MKEKEVSDKQLLGVQMLMQSLAYMADTEVNIERLTDLGKEGLLILFQELLKKYSKTFIKIANDILEITQMIEMCKEYIEMCKEYVEDYNEGVN